jgi:amino acid adenylation domain-containing protein
MVNTPDPILAASTSLVAAFEQVVAQYGGRNALCWSDGGWTYAELNARANRLAHLLLARGLKPEAPVAVLGLRGPRTLLAFLAVLKAGCAYVPLDPLYPSDLTRYLLEEAAPALVLVDPEWHDHLPGSGVPSLRLTADLGADQPDHNPGLLIGPGGLANILFTSGSTGKPKGVLIEHRGVLRVTTGMDYVDVGPEDVVLQYAPLNFDASTFEIWGAWLNGACLAVPPAGVLSLHDLAETIARFKVTTLWLTAGLFQLMVEQEVEAFASVRQVLTGGDVVSPVHAGRLLRQFPQVRLINGYGPTETTVFAACHTIVLEEPIPPRLSIGRPIRNTDIVMVDDQLRPVPAGETGEMIITGDGVARGYLKRPELTAQNFIEITDRSGKRVRGYRSGDLACYRPDGTIDFFGRRDFQVKINGLRIELDEVENVMLEHPQVGQAVVLAQEAGGKKRLEAYVVRRQNATVTERDLREHLALKLPYNWLPSVIQFVETLPLNANGKVDRASFRPPTTVEPATLGDSLSQGDAPDGAFDDVEKIIWSVWREMLPAAEIGLHDNFFDLGGDSLGALKMMAQVERGIGRKLTLQPLLEGGTIAVIAAAARKSGPVETPPLMTLIQAGDGRNPFFFSHGDYLHGGLFCYNLAQKIDPHVPFFAIGTPGFYDGNLPTSIDQIATLNYDLIRREQPHGPYFLGGFCNGALTMYEVAQRLIRDGEEVACLIVLDPPDFCFPPFARQIAFLVKTFGLGPSRHVLLVFITDLVMEFVFRFRSHGIFSAAKYLVDRAVQFVINAFRRASRAKEKPKDGVNLNFHYATLVTVYPVLPYGSKSPVTMLLRRAEEARYHHQIESWRKLVPTVRFEVVVGTHVDFLRSLDDVARSMRDTLAACQAEISRKN